MRFLPQVEPPQLKDTIQLLLRNKESEDRQRKELARKLRKLKMFNEE